MLVKKGPVDTVRASKYTRFNATWMALHAPDAPPPTGIPDTRTDHSNRSLRAARALRSRSAHRMETRAGDVRGPWVPRGLRDARCPHPAGRTEASPCNVPARVHPVRVGPGAPYTCHAGGRVHHRGIVGTQRAGPG